MKPQGVNTRWIGHVFGRVVLGLSCARGLDTEATLEFCQNPKKGSDSLRDVATYRGDIQTNERHVTVHLDVPSAEVISRMRMCHAHMGRLVLRPSVSPWHMTSLALLHAESLTWPPRRARATCNCISLLHMRTRALEVANPQGWQVPILEARVAYAWLVL